ncbi:hypothetical protein C0992_011307, partial [Termitomyces sp. T32_za158]
HPHRMTSDQVPPAIAAPMNHARIATHPSIMGPLDHTGTISEMTPIVSQPAVSQPAVSQPTLESLMASIMLNQEKTLHQNEELKRQGQEVQKQLASLEQQTTIHAGNMATGNTATRKLVKGRRKAVRGVCKEEPGVEDLGRKASELSVEAQRLRKHLQAEVTNKFRAVTGVSAGTVWPDPNEIRVNPTTNERYLMPLFKEQVNHPVNKDFFKAIAQNVILDLEVLISTQIISLASC